jgi:hypothetical protein
MPGRSHCQRLPTRKDGFMTSERFEYKVLLATFERAIGA